jgi:long-chain acyl-CoA synthetase
MGSTITRLRKGIPSSTRRVQPAALSGSNVVDMFRRNGRELADRPALVSRDEHGWTSVTWAEYLRQASSVAAGLIELGLEPGDRVAILSHNRLEWHLADLGSISARGVSVPIYPTSSSSQVAYQLSHSEARFCFVEGIEQVAKVLLRRHELPCLERIFCFDPPPGLDDPFVSTLGDLREAGGRELDRNPDVVDARVGDITPDDLATIVYTSGTTGPPKGTMITHGNAMATILNVTALVPIGPDDRFLSFLPLSHIAERTVSDFGQVVSGGQTWFASSLASVPQDLTACRPTIFFAVPRVWEKFHDAVLEQVAARRGPMRKLLDRYFALAARSTGRHEDGAMGAMPRLEYRALDGVVGRRIRHELGLDRARLLVSGAAPIHPELLRWFAGIGLPIAEVYGQTESTGVTSFNPPDRIRIGTVGPPVPGVTVRIAPDDEILVKGANVCTGYHRDEPGTKELIDEDGWMHTGDLGRLDEVGYLTITGRKKDLIINAAGKNISPEEIENRLRYEPLISQAVVIGDGRPFLVALLTLDADALADWAEPRGKMLELDSLRDDRDLLADVGKSVDRVNAVHSRVEGIKRWAIIPHDFTVADNELTPTLKVKRPVVEDRYADLVEELYARR